MTESWALGATYKIESFGAYSAPSRGAEMFSIIMNAIYFPEISGMFATPAARARAFTFMVNIVNKPWTL